MSRPLPAGFAGLRNGSQVSSGEAAALVVGMAAGEGPYCRLIGAERLWVESGWDGGMHFFVSSEAAEVLVAFRGESLVLTSRVAVLEPPDVSNPVRGVADEGFWARVRENVGGVTLLCERWAYGAYGCRWFRVTRENVAEVAKAVRPRSLLCVVVDPDLGLDPLVLEEGFTAMLGESALAAWCVVMPDPDGVARGQWEHLRRSSRNVVKLRGAQAGRLCGGIGYPGWRSSRETGVGRGGHRRRDR